MGINLARIKGLHVICGSISCLLDDVNRREKVWIVHVLGRLLSQVVSHRILWQSRRPAIYLNGLMAWKSFWSFDKFVIYYTQKIFTLSKGFFYFSNASLKSSRSLGGGGIKFQLVILLFYDHLLNLRLMKPETKAEFCLRTEFIRSSNTNNGRCTWQWWA
jgi:hypothetical protein